MSEYKGRRIGEIQNYDDTFTRDLIVATIGQFRDRFKWFYYFTNSSGSIEKKEVTVPVYYSLMGDTQFLIDMFTDDPAKPVVNTSISSRPVATLALTNFKIIPDQMSNPNVAIRRIVPDGNGGYQTYYTKVFPVPMEYEFELTAKFDSENDMFRYADVLMDTLFRFRFFKFEHKHTPISCFFTIPDTYNGQQARTISALEGGERELVMKQSITVVTRKPVFDSNEETQLLDQTTMNNIIQYINTVYNNARTENRSVRIEEMWVPDKPEPKPIEKEYKKPRWNLDDPVDYGDD
jgi:hypothetical protein